MNELQKEIMHKGKGFIAALDQSGGSTPKALAAYGVTSDQFHNEREMFDRVHEMRTRIIQSPEFTSDRILAVILFEETMNSKIDSMFTAEYLWVEKHIVSFLKIDQGLSERAHGVQLMKEIRHLDNLLEKAKSHKIFGTKMRSVIWENNEIGIKSIVHQQFTTAKHVLAHDLMPIIEPEVSIDAKHKLEIEETLKYEIYAFLDTLEPGQQVMFKLTPPEIPNYYQSLVDDPRVLRVVFLSGGYPQDKAIELLAKNKGVIASFSRAFTQGLHASQSKEAFDELLGKSAQAIYEASVK